MTTTEMAQKLMGLLDSAFITDLDEGEHMEVQESSRSDDEFIVVAQGGKCFRIRVEEDSD